VSWLSRWLHRNPSRLVEEVRREWAALAEPRRGAELDAVRFVALDTETSGLDPKRDRLLSIGACSIEAGSLDIGTAFAALLRHQQPSGADNVLIHGIGHAAQAAGQDQQEALAAYLRFARRDVLVGYHTLFDATVLQMAVRDVLGIAYRPVHLDLALLLPALEGQRTGWDLDRWLQRYRLRAFARHDALADAAAAGELFLVAQQRARARGLRTLRELLRLQKHQLTLDRLAAA
jgi:DNA polymerase III subunit epsilon